MSKIECISGGWAVIGPNGGKLAAFYGPGCKRRALLRVKDFNGKVGR